jgi:hypothetical protein
MFGLGYKNLFFIRNMGMIFVSYLTFFLRIFFFFKSCWTRSEQVKNDNLEEGVDGLSHFSLISVILFSNQDHPWKQENVGCLLYSIKYLLQAKITNVWFGLQELSVSCL